MKFIRFTVAERDPRTGQATGVVTLAYDLLREGAIDRGHDAALREHVDWLERHLPVPDRFTRTRNASHKDTHGLSWLKDSAAECVRRVRWVAEIIQQHGHPVDMRVTARPGYVVYEDDFQIVAEPFHGE